MDRIDHNRVIWHSRRGMLELDLVLEPFVKDCYPDLDEPTKALYRRLLECEDQNLFDWFLKKKPILDEELTSIVERILNYQKQRNLTDTL